MAGVLAVHGRRLGSCSNCPRKLIACQPAAPGGDIKGLALPKRVFPCATPAEVQDQHADHCVHRGDGLLLSPDALRHGSAIFAILWMN